MAGYVKVQLRVLEHGCRSITPDVCPAAKPGGPRYPQCVIVDAHAPWYNLCPFWYGLEITQGGTRADIRDGRDLTSWLLHESAPERSYRVLCLRSESSGTEATARLRS